MKAKYIFIVAMLLLPIITHAQNKANTTATNMRSVSTMLETNSYVSTIHPLQHETVVRPSYGHHTYGNAQKGISVDSYKPIRQHSVGVAAAAVEANYVAAAVDNTVEAAIQSVTVVLPRNWKGDVATIGASTPDNVLVKRRTNEGEYPDMPEDIYPSPLSDVPWWLMLSFGVFYVLVRRRQTTIEK